MALLLDALASQDGHFLSSIPLVGGLIAENPIHLLIEVILICFAVYLLMQKSYKPPPEKLSRREEDELIDEWTPEPLAKPLSPLERFEIERIPVVSSTASRDIVVNERRCINFASFNYLGLAAHPQVVQAALDAFDKYGCGSCGPRGFYGTLDTHLDLERKITEFLGTEGAIVYSDAYATATSVVPAFSQMQDFIVCDEAVSHSIRGGVALSRSTALWFKHNSMEDLERCLKTIVDDPKLRQKKLTRRWIIVEGVYAQTGQLCDLQRVVQLARSYCFRVMLDDSNGLGVLGPTGRGTWEHHGLKALDIDIIWADMSRSVVSTAGFCTGKREIVDHQRLNGSGYCYSASLPPYLSQTALVSINLIDSEPLRLQRLRANSQLLHDKLAERLSAAFLLPANRLSPFALLRLRQSRGDRFDDEKLLEAIVERCRHDDGIALTRAKQSRKLWSKDHIMPPPAIRVTVMADHTDQDIERLVAALVKASSAVLS